MQLNARKVTEISHNTENIFAETLKMEAQFFSETLAHSQNVTRRNNPENRHQYSHRRENLKSYKFLH
jgi:hypothetical protein